MADRWTKEEEALLIEVYPHNRKSFIEDTLKKDWMSIRRKSNKLGLVRDQDLIESDKLVRKQRKDAWTPDQNQYLRDIFVDNTKEYILSKIERPWAGIHAQAVKLGLKRNPDIVRKEMIDGGKKSIDSIEGIWTEEENEILTECYPSISREDILNVLKGRTWMAIRAQAFKLNLRRGQDIVRLENSYYTKKALMDKYGVSSYYQTEEFKEKSRKTNREKRGVDYPTQSPDVWNKTISTVQEKFGVDNVFQAEAIKDQIRSTNLERYGAESPLQNNDILGRVSSTTQDRYGVDNAFKMVDRVQKGMLDKYGETAPLRVPEIKEKVRKTNLERYGVEYPCQNEEVKMKLSETLRSPEVKKKKYETSIKNNTFIVSKEEVLFGTYLRLVDPETKSHQMHAALGHVIDFYSPLYAMWVQYDGSYWHGKVRTIKGPQSDSISKGSERDRLQDSVIPNLVRFCSSDVKRELKNGTLTKFIKDTLVSKVSDLSTSLDLCHQYKKRLEHFTEDIDSLPFNPSGLKASDFSYQHESMSFYIREFIERYEWLGSIGTTPKWCFTSRYRGILSGVVLINEPNAYSSVLGKNTKEYEALIQRGASASWTPKNLGSMLIMSACTWMVNNTSKRAFVGYADPAAGERGTIYRACNFEYLGDNFGNTYNYQHTSMPSLFTQHDLKRTSKFKQWCKLNKIEIKKEWFKENGFKDLSLIPTEVKEQWKLWRDEIIRTSIKIKLAPKMKFILVKGVDKREQKFLNGLKTYLSLPFSSLGTPLKTPTIYTSVSTNNKCGVTADRKTEAKIQYLIDNYPSKSRSELARDLNETPRWIKRQASLLMGEGRLQSKKL